MRKRNRRFFGTTLSPRLTRMAKKAGRAVAEPTGSTPVPSRDTLQRLSYLYQASVLLHNIGFDPSTRPKKRRRTTPSTPQVGVDASEAVATGSRDGLALEERDQDEARPRDPTANRRLHVASHPRRSSADSSARPTEANVRPLEPVSRHLVRTLHDVAKKATVRMCVLFTACSARQEPH